MSEIHAFEGEVLPYGQRLERWYVRDGVLHEGAAPRGSSRLPGRFLLPGLVDAHTHLTLAFANGEATVAPTPDDALAAHLSSGVLALRDTGVAIGRNVPRGHGRVGLPDVIGGSRYIAPPGTYFPDLSEGIEPALCASAAAAEIEAGATWVKVVADSPVTPASFFDPPPTFEVATLRAIVDTVHAAGGRVAAHVTGRSVNDVVRAGVDSIEHGSLVNHDALIDMAANKIAWTPTVGTVFGGVAFAESTGHEALIQIARPHLEALREAIPQAERLGVTVLVGTDMLGHGNLADEVAALVALKMSPIAALAAATSVAREYFGFSSFASGQRAEIVTYDADPRDDPQVLRHPVAIVHGGARVR